MGSPRIVTRPTLHVITNCTGRKSETPPVDACLRSVKARAIDDRIREWTGRLRPTRNSVLHAADLYAGEHWAVVKDLLQVAKAAHLTTNLWIASAGYGLLSSGDRVRSYSASFSAEEPDYVYRKVNPRLRDGNREWWKRLNALKITGTRGPRSLTWLARSDPKAMFMFVASPRYLSAMADDLAEAATLLWRRRQLTIVSSYDVRLAARFRGHVVTSGAGLSHALGGSLVSLNARVARDVLARGWLRRDLADTAEHYRSLAEALHQSPHQGRRLSDDQVLRHIHRLVRHRRTISASKALREFRDAGFACEQGRFGGLFEYARLDR